MLNSYESIRGKLFGYIHQIEMFEILLDIVGGNRLLYRKFL